MERILRILKPYVILKKKHIVTGMKILEKLPSAKTHGEFVKLCKMVDSFEKLNYSKKRTITSMEVENYLMAHKVNVPVETSS